MIVGIYGGLARLAVAMGPIVGGTVTQGISWHWIFWINVPIGAVALPLAMRLLGHRALPASRPTPSRRFAPSALDTTKGGITVERGTSTPCPRLPGLGPAGH